MNTRVWRGKLVLSGMANSLSGPRELRATVAETHGDSSRLEIWPPAFLLHLCTRPGALRAMHAWVESAAPPLCAFMPDRQSNPATHNANKDSFRAFARVLAENQLLAVAPWQPSDARLPGAGIILYPAPGTLSILVGVIFPFSAFPDFVTGRAAPAYPELSYPVVPAYYPAGYPADFGPAQYALAPPSQGYAPSTGSSSGSGSDSSWPPPTDESALYHAAPAGFGYAHPHLQPYPHHR